MDITYILANQYYNLVQNGLTYSYKQILGDKNNDVYIDEKDIENGIVKLWRPDKKEIRKKILNEVRPKLTMFLNCVLFNLHQLDEKKPQVALWWIMFGLRIKKALIFAMLLTKHTSIKYKSYNIPLCYVYLYDKLAQLEKDNFYSKFMTDYISLINKYPIFKECLNIEET